MNERSDTKGGIIVGCMVALALLGLMGRTAFGQSSIDVTVPATGADVLSAPIRSNFSLAHSEIDALFLKFPATASVTSVASYASSDGDLAATNICFLNNVTNSLACAAAGVFEPVSSSPYDALRTKCSASAASCIDFRFSSGTSRFTMSSSGFGITGPGGTATPLVLETGLLTTGDSFSVRQLGVEVMDIQAAGNVRFLANGSDPAVYAQQGGAGPVEQQTTLTTGDDPTKITKQGRAATTDATETTCATVSTATDKVTYVKATVVARVTGGTAGHAGEGGAWEFHAGFENTSGTVSEFGTAIEEITIEETNVAAWSGARVDIDVDGTTLDVNVTGSANENVTWHCFVESYTVGS